MGYALVKDIHMYYEIAGDGAPLVLIEGLGYAAWMWWRQVPSFSKAFKVITFDNRGVGQTDKPDEEYSVKLMADDLAGLLRMLGINRAHILGVSLGGFIAQQFALEHPDMVDRLILWSTAFGGPNMIPMSAATAQKILNPQGHTLEDKMRFNLSTAVSAETMEHPEIVDTIVAQIMENLQPPHAYRRQMMAGALFSAENLVSQIQAPTLIMAGSDDQVVPVANARLLGERIPGAQVRIINNAGHLFFIEKPEEANEAVLSFLS